MVLRLIFLTIIAMELIRVFMAHQITSLYPIIATYCLVQQVIEFASWLWMWLWVVHIILWSIAFLSFVVKFVWYYMCVVQTAIELSGRQYFTYKSEHMKLSDKLLHISTMKKMTAFARNWTSIHRYISQ